MFVLSKIGWLLVQPSNLIFLAAVVGLIYLHFGHITKAKAWVGGSLAAAFMMGIFPFSSILMQPLETRFTRPDLTDSRIDGIIMLSGAEEDPSDSGRELLALNDAAERLTETAALARRFPEARIVLSGGSGAINPGNRMPEAKLAQRLLESLGVPPGRITTEDRSRTTYENALLTADILKSNSNERWLLVTSAWHMPRAMGCFQNAGLVVEPWPVDYRASAVFHPLNFGLNAAEGLRRTDLIMKEYVGLLAYRLTGRIGTLWPGPAANKL
jgi:uncharacterized SAM-binding protein YcdF (DUF218 family)